MLPYQHYLQSLDFFQFDKELDFHACSISASLPSVPALFSCLLSRMSLLFWQRLLTSFLADQVYEAQSCKAALVPADVPRH